MPNPESLKKTSFFMRLLIKITGTDEETLRLCPSQDWDNVRAVGEIMLFTALYQTVLFCVISHRLFAAPGQIRPELVLASVFIAAFIMLIDSYMVMRSGWHLSGIEELKRGGLDISGGPAARIKAGLFLMIRIALAGGIAQLTAVFLSLLVFGTDIAAKIQNTYLQANSGLVASVTLVVEDEIARATESVRIQGLRVGALSDQIKALRQKQIDVAPSDPQEPQVEQEISQLVTQRTTAANAVRTAETFASDELGGIKRNSNNSGQVGDGTRRKAALEDVANAKRHAAAINRSLNAARARLDNLHKQNASASEKSKQQALDRLPEFERDLAAETAKLSESKDQLDHLIKGREDAIRQAVERAPNHVPVNNGLLAQIVALESVAKSDTKIAAVILLIDFVAFGFELAAVLAKVTSFVPTTYSALLARDAYMRVVLMVDNMMKDLDRRNDDADDEADILPPEKEDENIADRSSAPSTAPDDPSDDPCPFGTPSTAVAETGRRPRGRPRKTSLN